jgi:hypothetical protein
MRLKKLLALALAVVAPISLRAQNITTVAGGGSTNVPALSVGVGGPEGVIKDALGNVYILDNFFSRIFKVDTTGNMTIFAGNGTAGFSGDGGLPTAAQLNGPSAFFMDTHGNFFIADSDNNVIREIPAGPGINYGVTMLGGHIYTIAGTAGPRGYGGDGGAALSAQLSVPDGVFVDAAGNLFFGDRFNEIVREVPFATGTNYGIPMAANNMYTIAGVIPTAGVANPGFTGNGGPGTSAKLHDPWGVYGDGNGNIFIADSTNNTIRELVGPTPAAGQVTGDIYPVVNTAGTAGTAGDTGVATAAQLNTPHGVFFDAAGNLFISDYENHAIREVPAATTVAPPMTKGNIYTLAGTLGVKAKSADGTPAKTAGLAHPSNVFFDGAGNLFIANSDGDIVREVPAGTGTNYTVSMTAGDIYTIAGNGFLGFGGDGAVATNAELSQPFNATQATGLATDAAGDIFVADSDNDVIREVSGGNIQTVVGAPAFDAFLGDGGVAASGRVANPNGVFVDKAGNWFIADTANNAIREVPLVSGTNYGIPMIGGNIYTIAGNGTTAGFSGDQGPAHAALLNAPNSVFVDGSFNVFIADTGNNAIREIAFANGTNYGIAMTAGHIYTVAGTLNVTPGYNGEGKASVGALLLGPQGVFVDGFGNLFIADTANQIVREVPALSGVNYGITMNADDIYTVAGSVPTGTPNPGFGGDTGPATSALLTSPFTVLVDPAGNIFISDTGNNIVREVAAVTAGGKTANHIYTVAGTPQVASFSGDGGLATSAKLNAPQGLASSTGNLLVADSQNVRIRSVGPNLLSPAAPAALLSAAALTFTPAQNVGQITAAQTVTLTNTGGVALNISGVTLAGTNPGDFAFASTNNTCKTTPTLATSASCTISVTFTPTAPGARSAKITIADNAGAGQQNVSLSGTGVQGGALLSATTLTFTPAQIVGTPSAAQTVTLTNNGTALLTFAISLPGSDFILAPAAANTCVSPLAIGANCTISVEFTPTQANPRTASISITDNAPASPQTISLSGTGLPTPATATLSGTSITFASQLVTTASAVSSVTLTNNGTGTLTITNIGITGDFALTPTNPCGGSVATGAKCTIGVTFTPTASGARTGAVTITDNAGGITGSQQTINLTGAGLSLSFGAASNGSTTQTVKAGQTATYNLQLSAAGGAPTDAISVAVACTGAPALSNCSGPPTPVTVVPGTPAAFAVTVSTTAGGAAVPAPQFGPKMQPPAAIRTLPLFLLALLSVAIMLAWMQSRAGRMRAVRLACVAGLLMLPVSAAVLLQGCGGGSSGTTTPPPPAPGTPAGTSTLTVTFTPTLNGKAQAAQTTTLTLIVQ